MKHIAEGEARAVIYACERDAFERSARPEFLHKSGVPVSAMNIAEQA